MEKEEGGGGAAPKGRPRHSRVARCPMRAEFCCSLLMCYFHRCDPKKRSSSHRRAAGARQVVRTRQFQMSTHCHTFSLGVRKGTRGTPMGIIRVTCRRGPFDTLRRQNLTAEVAPSPSPAKSRQASPRSRSHTPGRSYSMPCGRPKFLLHSISCLQAQTPCIQQIHLSRGSTGQPSARPRCSLLCILPEALNPT